MTRSLVGAAAGSEVEAAAFTEAVVALPEVACMPDVSTAAATKAARARHTLSQVSARAARVIPQQAARVAR